MLRPYKDLATLHVSGSCQGVDVFKHALVPGQTWWDEADDEWRWTVPNASLTTPQWIGEKDVDLAVFLVGDDVHFLDLVKPEFKAEMRASTEKTWTVFMQEPQQLAQVESSPLQFGLRMRPRQCGNFDSSSDFDTDDLKAIDDALAQIPEPRPVAHRFPCLDWSSRVSGSLITRLSGVSKLGNFIEADTSIVNFQNKHAASMFPNATWIDDYPYPFVTGNHLLMEFPSGPCDSLYCGWTGAECRRTFGEHWLSMWQAIVGHAFTRKGIVVFCCHLASEQKPSPEKVTQFVKHVRTETDGRARFLTFKQAQQRMQEHMFFGQALRRSDGLDNGVRLLDLNQDGYMDVVVGNELVTKSGIWDAKASKWRRIKFPFKVVIEGKPTGIVLGYSSTGIAVAKLGKERAFLRRLGKSSWSWQRVGVECNASAA